MKSQHQLKIYIAPVLALFLLLLLLVGQGKATTGEQEERKLSAVIRGAVEDNSWWQARNREEVKQVLARYYTEPLLSQLTDRAWNFIAYPTDWYWKTVVTGVDIRFRTARKAEVLATLINTDVTNSHSFHGKAHYGLYKTEQGWRIVFVRYNWNEE